MKFEPFLGKKVILENPKCSKKFAENAKMMQNELYLKGLFPPFGMYKIPAPTQNPHSSFFYEKKVNFFTPGKKPTKKARHAQFQNFEKYIEI